MSTIKVDTFVDLSREVAATTPYSIGAEYIIDGTAKAWVKYNQVAPAVDNSLNVTSVTDSAAGLFQVNLTSAMADAEYATLIGQSCVDSASVNYTLSVQASSSAGPPSTYTTSAIGMIFQSSSGGNTDIDHSAVSVNGDLA